MKHHLTIPIIYLRLPVAMLLLLAACSPTAPATVQPTPASKPAEIEPTPTPRPAEPATERPTTSPFPAPPREAEEHVIEVEWPPRMRLGDSDSIRLSLFPSREGYTLTTEFPEHQTQSQPVYVSRPGGYDLFAVGYLEGVGFEITPQKEQIQYIPPGEPVTWRWTVLPFQSGKHHLTITLRLRWIPTDSSKGGLREVTAYSKSLVVNVSSFLGLSHSSAMATGFLGLVLGGGLSLFALVFRPTRARRINWQTSPPNPALQIEPRPGLKLSPAEHSLLQSLFSRYARLVLESEFLSGYSGARTFLALPVRADGRADAYTIAKIGDRDSIGREFDNYETFVKDTLPPITARIQHPPVVITTPGEGLRTGGGERSATGARRLAALQYTFIGEPGSTPTSLRQALLSNPNPALLSKLFETFGPNWWMQRHPYTFRLAQEYDRVLPVHLVIEPILGRSQPPGHAVRTISKFISPAELDVQTGEYVSLRDYPVSILRPDGSSRSLQGAITPGQPPVRIRWLSSQPPRDMVGKVTETRDKLLRGWVEGFERHGLPDPLLRLPTLLEEKVAGTQSTIHGDLNLENILVGPGNFIWLIDFAQTREGHPLFDFAHLEAEMIAHIIAPQVPSTADYLSILREEPALSALPFQALLSTLHGIADRCLFNPSQTREYDLALTLTCLGALKFANLQSYPKHLLYLTAAFVAQRL